MTKPHEPFEERTPYLVFQLGGVTFLPHYANESVYVGPGYRTGDVAYSELYLRKCGATESTMNLWKRATTGLVPNVMR